MLPSGPNAGSPCARLGRMQKLERLGLATPAGSARVDVEPQRRRGSLRALGDRGDIIRRLHQTMGARSPSEWVIAGESAERPVIGEAGRAPASTTS